MACRSLSKCEAAKKTLLQEIQADYKQVRGSLSCEEVDLSSLKSVESFAKSFLASGRALHSLINNGGVMYPPFSLTPDGFESTWGTNHMGPFLLTHLLYPALKKSAPATIVMVASNAHYVSGNEYDISKFNGESDYNVVVQYGRSKLANVLLARELGKRIPASDGVLVNSLNPGGVKGNLYQHLPRILLAIWEPLQPYVLWSEIQAGLTNVGMAFAPKMFAEKITGKYFVPVFRLDEGSETSRNATLAKTWYDESLKIIQSKGYKISSHF